MPHYSPPFMSEQLHLSAEYGTISERNPAWGVCHSSEMSSNPLRSRSLRCSSFLVSGQRRILPVHWSLAKHSTQFGKFTWLARRREGGSNTLRHSYRDFSIDAKFPSIGLRYCTQMTIWCVQILFQGSIFDYVTVSIILTQNSVYYNYTGHTNWM